MKIHSKNTIKSEIIVITQENLEEPLIIFVIEETKYQKKIHVVFHNGSTDDYHFIIKQLAIEFRDEFECLGENTVNILLF